MTATMLLALACPALGLIIGYYCLTEEIYDWRSGVLCLALFAGSFAFGYIPTFSSDLVRYVEFVERVSVMTPLEAMNAGVHEDENLWVFSLICWIISKTGFPQLLATGSTFLVYYIGLYLTGSIGEKIGADRKYINEYILFILMGANYFWIINNVRNVLSFSLIGFAIYRDVFEEKRDLFTLALYIFPLFIHSSAAMVLMCRLIVPLAGKIKYLALAACMFAQSMVDIAYEATSSLSSGNVMVGIIKEIFRKAHEYFHNDYTTWVKTVQKSGSYLVTKILYIALAFIMCFMANYCTKKLKKRIAEGGDEAFYSKLMFMIDFDFVLGLFAISCIPMLLPEYWRFSATMILFGAPVYLGYEMVKDDEGTDTATMHCFALLKKAMFVLVFGCMLLWFRDMRECVLSQLFTQPFVASPVVVLFRSLFERIAFYVGF